MNGHDFDIHDRCVHCGNGEDADDEAVQTAAKLLGAS